MSTVDTSLSQPRPRDPAVALWTVAAICWVAMVVLATAGGDQLGHHGEVAERGTLSWPARILAYQAVWTVMVGAMMLPTALPMARLVTVVAARRPGPGPVRVAATVSYLAVWAGFGVLALVGDLGVHEAVHRWPWLYEHQGLVLAASLGLAGAFQFSKLKDRCLTACRDPMSMLWRYYRPGPGGAWRLGTRHALSCLGCCWALMLVMFGAGAANLLWMLGLTAVMVAEKATRWGQRLTRPVGVALLAVAVLVAATALWFPPHAGAA